MSDVDRHRRDADLGTMGESGACRCGAHRHREDAMSRRPILNHPEDIHCIAFHVLVLAAYGLAFYIYLHPAQASITGPWSLAAFVLSAALLLGWISGIDI